MQAFVYLCHAYFVLFPFLQFCLAFRNFKLVRIDPQYLISICIGETHDRRGNIVYHQHLSQVATVEKDPDTSVQPVAIRSIRGGMLLIRPCIFARELLHTPPLTLIDQQSLSINLPQTVGGRIGEIVQEFKSSVTEKRKLKTYKKALKAPKDSVEPPVKIARKENEQSTPQTTSGDASFAEYLRSQPSTSRNRYDDSVEAEIAARKWPKSSHNVALISEHSYSQPVRFFKIISILLLFVLLIVNVFIFIRQ